MKYLVGWLIGGCFSALLVFGCSDDGASSGTGGSGGAVPPQPIGCDPLTPSYCAFPYPNDYYSVDDPSTATGRRLALPEETMPPTANGIRSNPDAFNEMDGFSPGIAAMTHFPGATVTGLPTPNSIGDSLEADSPTVIVHAETGEPVPHWVDLDEWAVQAKLRMDAGEEKPDFPSLTREVEELREEQALMLRPAVRLDDATRYIVAIRNVQDADGAPIAASPGFAALRDGTPSDDLVIESRRPHFEELFSTLADAGIEREELQLAWDFTTSSRENNTAAMVHIRDDAFERYSNGVAYRVELKNQEIIEGIVCRLEIIFQMPLYMTQGQTGGLLNLGDDGLPEQNGTFEYKAAMIVPVSAQEEGSPASLVAFGHGQLGTKEQVLGFQEIAAEANFAAFALDWKGFALDDAPTVIGAIVGGDMSKFRAIPERMHQGFLNFLMAMRTLSVDANGDASTPLNEALAEHCGGAAIDGDKRYYFGGSQGGIFGATLMALTTDIERGLLAVPGQSYNLLLNRSVNFDEYAGELYSTYGWNALHIQMNLALIQGLWDRGEPTGYSKYIRTNLLPNTPAHEVMIQVSKADHQVTNLGAHIMARTIGGVVNLEELIRPVWGIKPESGEHTGSAMIEIDFGNPDAPITNIPHWGDTMKDPHGRATELAALGDTLVTFYETGRVSNPCMGPCDENDLTP